MKKTISALLAAILVLGCFTGCAREDNPYVPTGDALVWDDPAIETTEAVLPDQQLTLVYYPEQSFNPYLCTDFTNRALFGLIYQGLFSTDKNYQSHPILCERYYVSEDLETYTIYIHEDATFSDGTVLTIEDVFASLQYAMESSYYKGRFTRVDEMYLTWDGGITFELETSYENFPLLLDVPIVKASEVSVERPLGTGPYQLDIATQGLRLLRRSNWWCRSGDLAATAAAIALQPAGSPTQVRDSFEFSDVGLVCANPGSDRYVDFRCDYELWDCESGVYLYLCCNMFSEVFSNASVRSALTYAIDRERIVSEYYRGFAHSATLPASPLSPYYDHGLAARYEYDGTKFVDAVNAAGLKNAEIKLLVNSEDSLRLRTARAIAEMLRECGLQVTLMQRSGNEYLYALNVGNYDLYLGTTKLSPNMDLTSFFAPGGNLRKGGISDAGIYTMCMDALENSGNYYNLHETVAADGRLTSVLFSSYAVYATRGLLTTLSPSRDNVFFYTIGNTMDHAMMEEAPAAPPPTTEGTIPNP